MHSRHCYSIIYLYLSITECYSDFGFWLQKIERLKASLHLLDVPDKPPNKHTVFVDTKKEGLFRRCLFRCPPVTDNVF